MDPVSTRVLKCLYPVVAIFLALAVLRVAYAASGNIDATDRWTYGTNIGWVNFRPADGSVTVCDDHLEGFAWAENVGWLRFGTASGCEPYTYSNASSTDYGVNRDGAGNLSGYAWGTNVGWIHLNPAHGGVMVNPLTGQFDGYAWGENIGWIHFGNEGAFPYCLAMQIPRLFLPLISH